MSDKETEKRMADRAWTTNVFLIHDIDTKKLLDFLGHVYFYPLADASIRSSYVKVSASTEEVFNDVASDSGVRAYLFYGSNDCPDKGLFLASRNPEVFRSIRTSAAFNERIEIKKNLLRIPEGESRLRALIKLVLRDAKRPGIVNTFGNPMRLIGKSGAQGCSVAEFVPEFRHQRGNGNSDFRLHIRIIGKTYVSIRNIDDIKDANKHLYLVGNIDDKCFLLSAWQARNMYKQGYPVRYKKDGRKDLRVWLSGCYGRKADALDSGEEDDRATMLSKFFAESAEKLRDAGCSFDLRRVLLGKSKITADVIKAVRKDIRQKLEAPTAGDFIPPFIPILKEGILPLIDLRVDTDRTPGTHDLVDELIQATAKKPKNLNLFFDCHGNLGTGPTLDVSEHDEHETAIAILHNKDFYADAKNRFKDPYSRNSFQSWQHLTVEDVFEAGEVSPYILPVTLQELAIKQMLMGASGERIPWRRFVVEPLWKHIAGVEVCSAGRPGKKYRRWCVSFPQEDKEVTYESDALSCWHEQYIQNEFLLAHEQGDPYHHYAFIRKDDVVIMIRVGGVDEHVIYDQDALSRPHRDRVKDMAPLVKGVHFCESGRKLFYVTGGVYSFNGKSGSKRHPSCFSAWVLGGSVQQARHLIEPLFYPHSTRLGAYPARPFLLRIPRVLFDLHEAKEIKEE